MKRPKEEVQRIWKEYKKTKDQDLKNILVEEYLPLVRYVAERLIERLPKNVQVEDLASDGVFGLLDAIDKFDLRRNVKFESYCIGRIRGSMLDGLRSMDWVPRLTRARANQLEGAYQTLQRKYMRDPTHAELAKQMKVSSDELDDLMKEVSAATLMNIQKKPLEKDDTMLGDVEILGDAKSKSPLTEIEKKDVMEFVTKNLHAKERYILMLYYFDDLTLKEIGAILGLSESRVCQLHNQLILKLRVYLKHRKAELV